MKQTAVEWLIEKLKIFATEEEMNIIEQAKEMEKEQIKNTFNNGYLNHSRNSEQYYNETFKSE